MKNYIIIIIYVKSFVDRILKLTLLKLNNSMILVSNFLLESTKPGKVTPHVQFTFFYFFSRCYPDITHNTTFRYQTAVYGGHLSLNDSPCLCQSGRGSNTGFLKFLLDMRKGAYYENL